MTGLGTGIEIVAALERCFAEQENAVAAWHDKTPANAGEAAAPAGGDTTLTGLILAQHFMNFSLWHIEDEARQDDVDDGVIAACKRRIDRFNQVRNDYMEKVDDWLLRALTPLLPAEARLRHNTESLGMAVDRLSILALKIYHMREQSERRDADEEHRRKCREKLAVLVEQRQDLALAVKDLIGEYLAGTKSPKLYYQFKMYNDPTLNPKLYGRKL